MEQIIFRPKLYKFDTLKAFTDEFKVGGSDLILTNKYIYDPYSDNNKCGAQVIYQEEFGGGEPTDTMVDAIIAEASKKHFERVIAIGGGTVIDIAKVLSVSDGGSVDSLYDHKDSITKLHQLIIIPTTCGTGSEVTSENDNKPVKRKRPGAGNHKPAVNIDTTKLPADTMSAIVAECSRDFKQPIVKSDEECVERLADFFMYYAQNGGLPTVEKMCLSLGADINTVLDWGHGTKGDTRAGIIKRAKNILAAIDADLVLKGMINPVAYIFRAKNYYGMKDQQDVVVQAKNIFGADVDRQEIERRLSEEVVVEDTTEDAKTE